jgi:hypothetical protein
MTEVKLIKVYRDENKAGGLRTNEVVGQLNSYVEVGSRIVIAAKPLGAGDVRVIQTSPITAIEDKEDNVNIHHTKSGSIYSLEYLKEDPDAEDVSLKIN